jgi:hypothetical protein
MIHADVEHVQPLQPRRLACRREELPRMVGKDVAREECGLDAPAFRVGEARRRIGRQRNELGVEAVARRRLGDPRAKPGVELVGNEQCGHRECAAAARARQVFRAFYLLC